MSLEVQIFGVHQSADTRKALRFFSERQIKTHFVDLNERAASPGELQRFRHKFGVTRLIDRYRRARASVGSRGGSTPRLIEITSAALRACARFYEPIAREDAALLEERTEKELEVILEYLRISYELTKRHTERDRGHARPCPAAEASRE